MNLKQFISPQYLFQVNSAFISPKEQLFLFAGLMLVLLSIVLKISSVMAQSPIDQKFRQKFYRLFLTIGLLELFWYLCRYENVKFFNLPVVAWLFVLIGIVWLAVILTLAISNYTNEKTVWEKEQVKLKYLPK